MDDFPQRKHPTHGVYERHNQSTIVMVTTCAKNRSINIATIEIQHALEEIWHEARGWLVGNYMIMPDHLHYFTTRGEMDIALEQWSQYWKSQLARKLPYMRKFWLPDHWDTRIRSADMYTEKLIYMSQNPVRYGLVSDPQEWPYQGQIFDLQWYKYA